MANVKMSFIGLLDMLRFKNMKVQRDRIIESTPALALVENYASNQNAAARHPLSQFFTIEDVQVRGKGDVKTFTLRRNDDQNPAFFRAGQFVVIRQMIDGKLIARPVTLSCGPAMTLEGKIQVTVKKVEQDAFLSAYIHENWKVGDTVETSGPQGTFFYEPLRDAKKVIAIAGGSGITPVYAMANAIADGDEDFDMTILYGSRTKADILFQEEFDAIMARTDKVRLVNVLSEEKADGCEHGFITAKLIKKYAGDGVYSIFAAGSKGMYQFLDGEAEKLGIERKYYRKELYDNICRPWEYSGYPMEAKDKVFNLKIKMCDRVFEIPCNANENILVALERAGVAGPNRCRGGICGWCRSRLLSGDVFIPEDTDGRRAQDKLDGYIHPCASFAVSDLSIEMPLRR
ncbi:MAG: iron-sulfur cluster-binding domain-containing protein [Oscillospiraceae bacterium]|nr:iron-sulfur cluster-binding domain-containing protein [Oscillospiraceae bacterium]